MKAIKGNTNKGHRGDPRPIESSSKRRKHTHKEGTPRTSWGAVTVVESRKVAA